MGEAVEFFDCNFSPKFTVKLNPISTHRQNDGTWFEEEIDDDLRWSFALNRVLHRGTSEYQDIAVLDTQKFGKVLVIDGKMQSAEVDEFIYHEKHSLMSPKEYTIRYFPSKFNSLVAQRSLEQKAAVNEICFRGLLSVPCTKLVYSCRVWIVRHFNPLLSQVEFEDGRNLPITDAYRQGLMALQTSAGT